MDDGLDAGREYSIIEYKDEIIFNSDHYQAFVITTDSPEHINADIPPFEIYLKHPEEHDVIHSKRNIERLVGEMEGLVGFIKEHWKRIK